MSEEEDFIIITIEDNSDDDDDINVVIVEDSETEPTETEPTENTLSADGMLTIEPNVQASNYNYQQLSQVTNGERGLPALDDVAVSQVNHLGNMKRHSSNSVDVGLLPLHKRGRSSLRGDNMESCASGGFSDANPQNQPMKLQHHYEVIYDAIQNLDKKFDVIHGKVSKIHRFRAKALWQNRKPLGYAYKNYSYLLSRKIKFQKMRKKEPPSSFSYPESYSPTMPVERPTSGSPPNIIGSPYRSEVGSPEQDRESFLQEQEPNLSQSPPPTTIYSSHLFQPYFSSKEPVQGSSSMPCYHSPGAHSSSMFSPTRACTATPGAMMAQGEPSLIHNPEMMAYPTLMENQSLNHAASSHCIPPNFATSSPIRANPGFLKRGFPDDPSTWSVDEVIEFLKHRDPQTLNPIADLFRQHDIDGKALLLLKSDMMIKYMGLKLGTAVKLCHYIDKLKEEKFFNN